MKKLDKERVLLQAQSEKKWLTGLLGNKRAVVLLLGFFKKTDIGGREGAREIEIE